jgi:hypothetical protein
VLRWLLTLLVLLVLGAGLGWLFFRDALWFALLASRLEPDAPFASERVPPPPDYFVDAGWAALPWREDPADLTAGPYEDRQETAPVDVFFVHPTTYYSADGWNQPPDHAPTNRLTDLNVMRGQASVFNGCCRIYAPRYRQATLFAFMDQGPSGPAALDLAYRDVLRAFEHYLAAWNGGRPFVLAGHSQGSYHLDRLLRERIAGSPEAERMVAAYPVGATLARPDGDVPTIDVCDRPDATGCLVTWNSVGPAVSRWRDPSGDVCVNPLTWRTDGAHAPMAANPGSLQWPFVTDPAAPDDPAPPPLERGIADAQCVDGQLLVTEIASERYDARPLGRDNYHVYDFGLFWDSLRTNVETRVNAWAAEHGLADAYGTPD